MLVGDEGIGGRNLTPGGGGGSLYGGGSAGLEFLFI